MLKTKYGMFEWSTNLVGTNTLRKVTALQSGITELIMPEIKTDEDYETI